ncbi:MAG: helix-turn-helix domain-containing protein [Lachnospiraceae bacterium]|nr:helix-turn-helix domain-containing protein [Lachnospiraceae bacterium]
MIAKQVVQTCIDELRELTRVDFCVIDTQGIEVASTFPKDSLDLSLMSNFFDSPADSQIIGGNYLFKVKEDNTVVYILVSRGGQTDGYIFGKIAVNQLQQLLVAYKEQYDHTSFIQNLILDNLLLVDIYNKAKKLGIAAQAERVVFLVEVSSQKEREAQDILRSAFAEKMDDYVTAVDEKRVILVHTLESDEDFEDMEQMANMLIDIMNTEAYMSVRVSYGTIVKELKDISKSYKEAKMALDVGKIFYTERDVIAYDSLGIGRLIYQLPVNLCRMFIQEIFGDNVPLDLDEETLMTVNKFFENNLNVSESSRQLYVHRNTLVYRIERLKNTTGLDIRVFDDALTLKIALMVVNYLRFLDEQDYDYE